MGAFVLAIVVAAASQAQDSIRTYGTPAAREVVTRASARFHAQDTLVRDYRADIRYRLAAALGRGRWERALPAAVEEQAGRVAWQRPNDLRVDITGRRARSRVEGLELSSFFSRPWFVPRGVGDSVRLFSDEFPATGALHPLGRDADFAYHYDLTDSLTATLPDGRRLKLYAVEFVPRRIAPALIAGRLWLDAETHDVARLTYRYVGEGLWEAPEGPTAEDSADAKRTNAFVSRILTIDADLEYGLQDGRYWMPFRQSIVGTARIPLGGGATVSFRAVTRFSDYEINTGTPIAFELPVDSTRGHDRAGQWRGGRFELHRPSNDSLAVYREWTDSLTLASAPEEEARLRDAEAFLATLAEELPDDLVGRRAISPSYERASDAIQYNRVQGLSLGAGVRISVPGSNFTNLYLTGRYGFSDERGTARASIVRDAPGGRLVLSGYRDISDLDPFAQGRSLANSANALFTAHDHGDYALATGGRAELRLYAAPGLDLTVSGGWERQRSTLREARSAVNDWLGGTGQFPLNPPILEGDFGVAGVRVDHFGGLRWTLAADGLKGAGVTSGRVWGEARKGWGGARGFTVRLKGGVADAAAPPQMLFRLGGQATVRGFEYASIRAPAFWAAQLDVSPLNGTIRPLLFLDAGQAGSGKDLFGTEALVGGGIGVSMYSPLLRTTLIRFDLSHPITPEGGEWRFDLVFSPVR
ncbi:MAG TPA: hypothetical protein VFS94_01410 [Gemmatimonadales bacterium]|nr:hypothetical protein [Gemmatimonadales bacterium]